MKKCYSKYQLGDEATSDYSILESGEVFKDNQGNINQVSPKAPVHHSNNLLTSQGIIKTNDNNGGILLGNVASVLSNTQNNRNTKDKSYGKIDKAIKITPEDIKTISKNLPFNISTKNVKSPTDLFFALKEGRDKKAKELTNFKASIWRPRTSQTSEQANLAQAAVLPLDEELYDLAFNIQEYKKPLEAQSPNMQLGGDNIDVDDEFYAEDNEIDDLLNQGYDIEYLD